MHFNQNLYKILNKLIMILVTLILVSFCAQNFARATTSKSNLNDIQFIEPQLNINHTNKALQQTNEQNQPNHTSSQIIIETSNEGKQQSASSTQSSWIKRILISVDQLNFRHQPDSYEHKLHTKTSDSNEDDEFGANSSSSQAPTDSGEDPLEADPSTTATSFVGSIPASRLNESFSSPVDILDDEQKLVESNNLREILASGISRSSGAELRSQQATTSANPSAHSSPPRQAPPLTCNQAYTKCALRRACAPALRAYEDDCDELINNKTSHCSARCLKAMIALRSSEEGDDFVNCDCQSNEYCLQSKQRSQACRPQVDKAIDPKTIVSCSTASLICLADTPCSTALDYYFINCHSLFSRGYCSMHCNNSLAILNRQTKAFKLINCRCDGSEEFPCVKYKTYTERLCLNKQTLSNIQIGAAANDGEQTDDDINLTSDQQQPAEEEPSPNSGGVGSLSIVSYTTSNGEDEHSDDNDDSAAYEDYDNSRRAANQNEESTPTSSNRINLLKNNWLPLISGGYFTNLHRQQQQQQSQNQQQSHKQIKYQSQNRQQVTLAPNQTRSRSRIIKQKNMAANDGYNGRHREGSRMRLKINIKGQGPQFLASTSSSPSSNSSWSIVVVCMSIFFGLILV